MTGAMSKAGGAVEERGLSVLLKLRPSSPGCLHNSVTGRWGLCSFSVSGPHSRPLLGGLSSSLTAVTAL